MPTPNVLKENMQMPGDIIRIPHGRSWRKAKIVSKLSDSLIRVKFRHHGLMKEVDITTDAIMTEGEVKAFQKAGGNTQIVRREGSSIMGNVSDEELNPSGIKIVGTSSNSNTKKRKFFGLL